MKYVALLRGIGPTNPNMRNEKLRAVFEELGFTNVQTVIASGNVLFETNAKSIPKLELRIEEAIEKRLKFRNPVIIRSQTEIERLVKEDQFSKMKQPKNAYLLVTFMRVKPFEVFNAIDPKATDTPAFMSRLEKTYSKEITSRTWKTVHRILAKMTE